MLRPPALKRQEERPAMPKRQKAAPDPLKQLARLHPRADLTVLGGKRLLGMYIQEDEGEQFQPEIFIWLDANNGMILGSQLLNPQTSPDGGVTEALAGLAEALVHPQAIPFLPVMLGGPPPKPGSLTSPPKPKPGLPASIQINDAALAQAAQALFE